MQAPRKRGEREWMTCNKGPRPCREVVNAWSALNLQGTSMPQFSAEGHSSSLKCQVSALILEDLLLCRKNFVGVMAPLTNNVLRLRGS